MNLIEILILSVAIAGWVTMFFYGLVLFFGEWFRSKQLEKNKRR